MTTPSFQQFLLPQDNPRLQLARNNTLADYAAHMLATDKAQNLKAQWQRMLEETFTGITSNGEVIPYLYPLDDEGFEVEQAVAAAQQLVSGLTEAQQEKIRYPLDSSAWRAWYNPEIPFNELGLRLEQSSAGSQSAFLALLRSCTSERGAQKVQQLMDANHFLGELYDITHIMNRWSFHFLLFGEPSMTRPWGWSIYGHHVAFCCLIVGRQLVIAPTFMGVEPNVIARGNANDCTLFTAEEQAGLALMQSLRPSQQETATIFHDMEDPQMPPERFNFADQRHLAGAFQDNRVIPLEGICAAEFSATQQRALMTLIAIFLEFLPDGPRAARLALIERHLDQTWWSWIGGSDDEDVFYFRIQSPVVLLEFDHHSGMWLTNQHPERFHIHTITRLPNGNDYGKALLKQLTP
ncbi:DUF3500 domain-containing protein [Candidatus Pantoea multigeneris]|uniref:DUF3500 domain-containing protein n=1 Tax=Candidatus Pantoea multigeneris TaxID=2608357 RepID=A0ABX0RD83_9GAMM|nr:DUF3500 domain-containing protein [Pantoea multigeneris]NIF22352.1 DUF3500 domain-containing protein [Pantoea multigeneris]